VRDERFALLVTLPVAIFLLAWVVYPIGYSFWLSINNFVVQNGALTAVFAGASNYVQAVQDPSVQRSFYITLEIDALGIILTVAMALSIALVLNEVLPISGFWKVVALLPWAISDFGTGVVWKWIWIGGYGLFNGLLTHLGFPSNISGFITTQTAIPIVAVAYAWHLAPLGAFFLLASLSVIPQDLYNAAKIDGANFFQRFRRVTYPFIRYSLLITLVIATLFITDTIDEVLTITGGGPGVATATLTYQIYSQAFVLFNLGYSAAISYLTLAFVIALASTWFRLLTRRH
jgi:multiple sugar transport system permease protein